MPFLLTVLEKLASIIIMTLVILFIVLFVIIWTPVCICETFWEKYKAFKAGKYVNWHLFGGG